MNIEQIKHDMDNGIMVCRETYHKLVNASIIYRDALVKIEVDEGENGYGTAIDALEKVADLYD